MERFEDYWVEKGSDMSTRKRQSAGMVGMGVSIVAAVTSYGSDL
jgi:hypothetical protein